MHNTHTWYALIGLYIYHHSARIPSSEGPNGQVENDGRGTLPRERSWAAGVAPEVSRP